MQGNTERAGVVDTLKIMIKEGPLSFYKGMLSPLVGYGIGVSI